LGATIPGASPADVGTIPATACADNQLTPYCRSSLCLWTNRVTSGELLPPVGTIVDTLQQQFGTLIRRRRLASGLGQEGLADKATLHRTHVSLLERGKRMPSLLVIKKLAAALETTMASLMAELEADGESPTPPRPRKKGPAGED
jgi:DNA-binding XRE family transcriptional regulator